MYTILRSCEVMRAIVVVMLQGASQKFPERVEWAGISDVRGWLKYSYRTTVLFHNVLEAK